MTSVPRPTGQRDERHGTRRPALDRTVLRLACLIPGGLSLLLGLNAALLLLGVWAPLSSARIADLHGPLMVYGFVGTLIVLERAVAARRVWGFLAPVLLGLGSLSLLAPIPASIGNVTVMAGFVMTLLVYAAIRRRLPAAAIDIQILGAVAGLISAILWVADAPVAALVPGMTVFLILTIAGERLELARISPEVDARSERLGLAASTLLVAAAGFAPLWSAFGYPALGVALALLLAWLFRYDVATRLIGATGLPRYMAVCLLAGYLWLLGAAGIWLVAGEVSSGPLYDALLHMIFLGFVMSMIMAHAPVILPAVLRVPLPYRSLFYVPVALLHFSLAVRTLVGDARGDTDALAWGGILNVASIVLFLLLAVGSAIVGPPKKAGASAPDPTASAASADSATSADPAGLGGADGPEHPGGPEAPESPAAPPTSDSGNSGKRRPTPAGDELEPSPASGVRAGRKAATTRGSAGSALTEGPKP